MSGYRLKQQEAQIRIFLSKLLQQELKDPRIGFVSITDVTLTRDLSICKVYVSVFGDQEAQDKTLEALTSAQGFIRREMSKRVKLRRSPELEFINDHSIAQGAKINKILKEVDQRHE